jgi:hypothetical protein
MLRHGHLSPHSKLLPHKAELSMELRPGSMISVASTSGALLFPSFHGMPLIVSLFQAAPGQVL